MITIDRERLLEEIRKKNAKGVLLQFPEGLKHLAWETSAFLQKNGIDVIVAAEQSFGACDIYEGLDDRLVVNFGHSQVYKPKRPVLFFYVEDDFDFIPVLSQKLAGLPRRVGLLTTVQHLRKLPLVKEFLESKGFKAYLGKGKGRIRHEGQVLGCNFSSARAVEKEVDAFLYLGSGMFHPLGISLSTAKPVFRCFETLEDVGKYREKILKQRYGQIFLASKAKRFGILVSRKPGQRRMGEALRIKEILEEMEKDAIVMEMDFICEEKVSSMGLDAYVICACPRIAIDDVALWKKPVLTPPEVEILWGKRKAYVLDEIE